MDSNIMAATIADELKKRKGKAISKNVILAGLNLFINPIQSFEKLCFGINDDIANEKLKIEQDAILNLICQIDDSVNQMITKLDSKFKGDSVIINGIIEVKSKNSATAIGIDISENSPQVRFKPGTKVTVDTENTNQSIGVKIGGKL